MEIEEAATSIIRNLDSVKCKIRDAETDELLTLSLSDLTETEKVTVLNNCSDDELKQVVLELGNSFMFVISAFIEDTLTQYSDERRVLYPLVFSLSDELKRFGDDLEISLPEDCSFMKEEEPEPAKEEPEPENPGSSKPEE